MSHRTGDADTDNRATYDPALDGPALDILRARVLNFFLTHDWAGWYTDAEICAEVGNTVGGVGAKRRDLRKEEYGGYIIEPRRRGNPKHRIWEYQFRGKAPVVVPAQQELDLAKAM